MYKLLRAKTEPAFSARDIARDAWRQGARIELPTSPVTVEFEGRSPAMDFYWGIPPLFSARLLETLRSLGADNLDECEIVSTPSELGRELRLVNVVGTVSLASFVLDLELGKSADTLVPWRSRLEARRLALPRPTALVSRLTEWNRPLLIRSDLEPRLASFTNLSFVDVVHVGDLTGTDFDTYLREAVAT